MLFYENSNGEKINLDEWPIVIEDITSLFGSEWKYEAIDNKTRNSVAVRLFYRTSATKKLNLQVFADSEEEFDETMDRLNDIMDVDVIAGSPGKLWYGDYYLSCYAIESQPKEYEELFYTADVEKTLISPYPFWISKHTYDFHSYGITSSNNKRYPGKYPYRYANGLNSNYIINPHFTDANFQLIIYGPVVNPQVSIGNIPYLVNITLEEGEYLIIDSRSETVTKVMNKGERINAFHNRQKGRKFFQKIPPGRQLIAWTGKFDFDLIIFEERGEPRWKSR
jgi:hypothetical protein